MFYWYPTFSKDYILILYTKCNILSKISIMQNDQATFVMFGASLEHLLYSIASIHNDKTICKKLDSSQRDLYSLLLSYLKYCHHYYTIMKLTEVFV